MQPTPIETPELAVAVEHPEKSGHPDGVPHDVVGLLALVCVVIAGLTLMAFLAFGIWGAVPVGVLGAGFLMFRLPRRARRERTEEAIADQRREPDPPA